MKKFSILITALIISALAYAQPSIGLKGGLNLANVSGDIEDNSMRTAFHVGAYATIKFGDKFGFQPEILYNSVGTKFKDPDFGDADLVMNYISVPLMLNYYINDMIALQAGPQISLLSSADLKFDGGSIDYKDFVKGNDMGLNFGAMLNFGKLNATARYCLGLTDIDDTGSSDKVKNGVIQISLGFRLFGGD
jgi:hypothetical protein